MVEDQAINRQILRHMLSLEYEVVEAENGAEALRVLAREPVKNAAGAVQTDPLREVARENLDNLRAGGGSAR